MIQIEDTKEIPEYLWTSTSSKEYALMPREAHEELIQKSNPVKVISFRGRPLVVAGLFRSSLLSIPYLWVLVTQEFRDAKPGVVRAIVRVTDTLAPRCETLVEDGNEGAERLARVFKFRPTVSTLALGDQTYTLYRRG